jgi:hypothetical protein
MTLWLARSYTPGPFTCTLTALARLNRIWSKTASRRGTYARHTEQQATDQALECGVGCMAARMGIWKMRVDWEPIHTLAAMHAGFPSRKPAPAIELVHRSSESLA